METQKRDSVLYFILKDGKIIKFTKRSLKTDWRLLVLYLHNNFTEEVKVFHKNGQAVKFTKPKRGSGHERIGGHRGAYYHTDSKIAIARARKYVKRKSYGKGQEEERIAATSTAYSFNPPYKGIVGGNKRFTVGSIYYLLKNMGCPIGENLKSFRSHFKERFTKNEVLAGKYSRWLLKQSPPPA